MLTAVKSPPSTSSLPTRKSSGGGGFWLLVLIVVGAIGAVFVLVPDLPRSLLGLAKAADRKQESDPSATTVIAVDTQKRDHQADTQVDVNAKNLAKEAKPGTKQAVAPVVVAKQYLDESKAQGYLADAEKAYHAMQWTAANNAAHKLDSLDVTPKTKVRAKDIAAGATALDKLFKDLGDDKDELIRDYDTNPSLVEVETSGSPSLAVPIISIDNPVPIEGNPVDAINAQRASGKINLLIKGRKDYMPASMPADLITKVTPVDLTKVMATKRSELTDRINRLSNGSERENALAWYYAGRFAYRNRIDELVTEMMDKAVILDPKLVSSVREDKAATLYANVICHIKDKNSKQADAFMAIISRKFADTDQGKQAKLFYEGKTTELLALNKAADERRTQLAEEILNLRISRAQELGDEKGAKLLAQAAPAAAAPEPESALPASATTSDAADTYHKSGLAFYALAQQLGTTTERNNLYHQAAADFLKAKSIYGKLLDKNPNDEGLAAKMVANQALLFGAIKYATDR